MLKLCVHLLFWFILIELRIALRLIYCHMLAAHICQFSFFLVVFGLHASCRFFEFYYLHDSLFTFIVWSL